MTLRHDWKKILRSAWSIRFLVLAFLFTVAEVALPLLGGTLGLPAGTFAVLSGLAVGGAFVTRLIAQKTFAGDKS